MMHANWIQEKLDELAEKTTIDNEIWRAAYTEQDRIAKELVKSYMADAGLEVREDPVGNVYGRMKGPSEGVILTGSHIDTVKNGGKYDGALGVITAISVLKNLIQMGEKPRRTIEIVAFTEEEGSRFELGYIGSRAVAGKLTEKDLLLKDANHVSLNDAMISAGYDPKKIDLAIRDDIDMYIELHIEQGPVLEQQKKQIGIVQNIVGLRVYGIQIRGEQNHAGTTPMQYRKDPVKPMAELITKLNQTVENLSKTATLTFGNIVVLPGMSNVVPKSVDMLIDLRDGDNANLDAIESAIKDCLKSLENIGYGVTLNRICNEPAVQLSSLGINHIREAVIETGLEYMEISSGAGHDAQILADKIPSSMIFIPSKNGLSHTPLEYSSIKDIEAGAEVLEKTLMNLAW